MVDGLKSKFDGKLKVILLDVRDGSGEEAAAKYHIHSIPTFILLDRKGNEHKRYFGIPPDENTIEQFLAAQGVAKK